MGTSARGRGDDVWLPVEQRDAASRIGGIIRACSEKRKAGARHAPADGHAIGKIPAVFKLSFRPRLQDRQAARGTCHAAAFTGRFAGGPEGPSAMSDTIMRHNTAEHRPPAATFDDVAAALEPYLAAARTGTTNGLRACFHDDARIVGWIDGDYLCLDPDAFVAWVASNGGSPRLQYRIVSIDVAGTAASVRVEIDEWLGFRFTDLFVLNKGDDGWRISSKVYDTHGRTYAPGTPPLNDTENFRDLLAVDAVVAAYLEATRTGDRNKLRAFWLDHARIRGRLNGQSVVRDPDTESSLSADHGNVPRMRAQMASLGRSGVAALARIETTDGNIARCTDFLTLSKGPTGWRIAGKVFDATV